MTNELPDQTKRAVEEFIDEGGYQVGEPGPHMSEQRIAAVLDELDARLDDALPDGTELERARARRRVPVLHGAGARHRHRELMPAGEC